MTEQTLFFTCPHCEERFAQVEEPDKDIHTGETYHCGSCGIQIIFTGGDGRGLRAAATRRGGTATSASPNPAGSGRERPRKTSEKGETT